MTHKVDIAVNLKKRSPGKNFPLTDKAFDQVKINNAVEKINAVKRFNVNQHHFVVKI
jgi:hypothetical protein